jgi:hypothetical protein
VKPLAPCPKTFPQPIDTLDGWNKPMPGIAKRLVPIPADKVRLCRYRAAKKRVVLSGSVVLASDAASSFEEETQARYDDAR